MSLLALVMMALAAPASGSAPATCDRYAAPSGSDRDPGSLARPFRTAQRLADAVGPGQTGCLLNGTFDEEVDGPYVLNVRHGGRRGAPMTIRSAPGQRATLRGIVIVPRGANHVTLSDLDIDGRRPSGGKATGVQINARHTVLQRSDITNRRRGICSVLGYRGWGRAVRTVVRDNVFHECGGTRNQLEHSLYIEYTRGVRVTGNLFVRSGTYAIHLFPEAHGSRVAHNVMLDNGGGVIFAGEGRHASTDNVVTRNLIAGSYRRPGILSWWGGRVGRGNVARDNCLSNPTADVDRRDGGFSASGNLTADPGFRNPAAGDFRLAAGSPCLARIGFDPLARLEARGVLLDRALRGVRVSGR